MKGKTLKYNRLPGVVPHQIGLFLFCIEFGSGWTKLVIVLCKKKRGGGGGGVFFFFFFFGGGGLY